MLYLVSYDIRKDKNRNVVIAKLKSMKAKKVLKSQWILGKKNTNANKLRSLFRRLIDQKKDRLFVNSLNPARTHMASHRSKTGLRTFLTIRKATKGT